MSHFSDRWRQHYGNAPPLSFALREAFPERWLRFHALPGSRRYPNSDADRTGILLRANTLASETLGEGACWLVQPGAPELGWPVETANSWSRYNLSHIATYEHDEVAWPAYTAPTSFRHGAYDDLLLDVAENRAFRTLWVAENGHTFAPYDGGFDIFMNSRSDLDPMRSRHIKWLPDTPSGL